MKELHPIFQKIAGSRQLVIKTVQDLAAAVELDPAHWAVIGMPTDSIIYDPDFLEMVDTDQNKRIRPDELRNAISWLLSMMKDPEGIETGSKILKLSAINPETEGADVLLSTAHIILKNLGTPDCDELTLEQVMNRKNLVLNSCGNGDGVITSENNEDLILAEYIKDAITVCGSVPDITGLPGINAELAGKFQVELDKCYQWHQEEKKETLFPYGEQTQAFYEKFTALEEVLNHYFFLCNAVAGGRAERFSGLTAFDPLNSGAMSEFLKNAPCAVPVADKSLSLNGWLNPEKTKGLSAFVGMAHDLQLTESADCLTEQEWLRISEKLQPRKAWLSRTPAGNVNSIPEEKIKEYLDHDAYGAAMKLIESDAAVKKEIDAYASLRKLILFQHHMIEFVNNFINLSHLFDPGRLSLIQPGHLIMDSSHYTLVCKVTDIAAHKKIILRSNICVMYVALSTGMPSQLKTMNLAVAITSGSMRDIFIGRTGVFIGKDGIEWDAKVVDFVQQPVSLGEAIQMPFLRFGEFLEKQADKFFSSKSKALETSLSKDITTGKVPDEIAKTASKQTPAVSGSMMLMGGGIGIAALGSAFALIVNTLKSIPVWNVLLILIGIIFIISGPMIFVSIIKLCRRYVSDFFAAGSWAVNPRMRLSNRMGLIFTHVPSRPYGAKYLYRDIALVFSKEFIDKKARFRVIFYWSFLAVILCGIGFWIYLKWFY